MNEILQKLKYISLTISHNGYKADYQTIKMAHDSIDREDEDSTPAGKKVESSWISPKEKNKSFDTGEIWEITWYPNTPVGSITIYSASLEAALEYIKENYGNNNLCK